MEFRIQTGERQRNKWVIFQPRKLNGSGSDQRCPEQPRNGTAGEFRMHCNGRKRRSEHINANTGYQPDGEIPEAMQQREAHWCLALKKVGSAEGIIIANHMNRKLVADANQVWPSIGIHIIDMVQPPGISISEHMERQK